MDSSTHQAIRELQVLNRGDDWGARVQNVCESAWRALSDPTANIDPSHIDLLTALLQDQYALSVAQLIIPDLRRGAAAQHLSPHQQKILSALGQVQANQPVPTPLDSQDLYETPVTRAEKRAYYDADAYRARLFLRQHENLDSEQRRKLEAWLKECPVKIGADDVDVAAQAASEEHARRSE